MLGFCAHDRWPCRQRVSRLVAFVCFLFQLMLMHYKADVNAPDNEGNTPLHLCTANGHEKVKLAKS